MCRTSSEIGWHENAGRLNRTDEQAPCRGKVRVSNNGFFKQSGPRSDERPVRLSGVAPQSHYFRRPQLRHCEPRATVILSISL